MIRLIDVKSICNFFYFYCCGVVVFDGSVDAEKVRVFGYVVFFIVCLNKYVIG